MESRIEITEGDITRIRVDAIVNAANTSLLGGGGVDGAIHRVAGLGLLRECRTLGGCAIGEAKMTRGYDLPAKYVIHTVGPVWRGGQYNEDQQLANCYRNSLRLATRQGLKTLAFPCISTGAYRFPLERACRIAIEETKAFFSQNQGIEKVTFICFGHEAFRIYKEMVNEMFAS